MSRYSFLGLHRPTRKALTISTLALIVISGAVVGMTIYKGAIAQAVTLATTHRPETFTELYFVNSSALPSYSPAQRVQHVSFHITNHEAKQMTYTYVISQDATQIAHAMVTLDDGKGTDIPFSFMIAVPNSTTQLSVHLENRSEHVDFRSKS